MNVREALDSRRSIKQFDPEHTIDDSQLRALLGPVLTTPTSFNLQHFRFVVVRDRERQADLATAAYGQVQVADCSAVVIVLSKLPAQHDAEAVWADAPERLRRGMLQNIHALYDHDATLRRDEAIRSGGLASMALMLNAVEMGFATCPLIGFDDARARVILAIPDDHVIVLLICVGKELAPPHPRVGRFTLQDVVRLERFDGEPLPSSEPVGGP